MAESKLRDLSMDFSVKVIKLCDVIKGHHSLVTQLERSATSIGAMERVYIKGGFLNIELKNPELYFEKKNWLQIRMIKGNLRLGYGDACISSERFKKEWKIFFDEFDKRMKIEG